MSSFEASRSATDPVKTDTRRAKLHKRGGSASSLPGSPHPTSGTQSQFTTPFATYEEPLSASSTTTPNGSTTKLRPYLRKMSTAKDDPDQGSFDLSKSISENTALAGLGIQDLGPRYASDVAFIPAGRRSHNRNTSGESHTSTASGSLRPTKPFVHPMRQTPRPYTPPHGNSHAPSLNDDERNESDDILTDDDFRLTGGPNGYRSRRSASLTSTPVVGAPTPLSQSHTASDLGLVPKITNAGSQTNLSLHSSKSRSRRNTERSLEMDPTTASARTSFDIAFSLASRRSETESLTRDQRIEVARRKFEAQEAKKGAKHEVRQIKRRETEEAARRKGSVSQEKSGSYEATRPRATSNKSGEKAARRNASETQAGAFSRFSAWFQTRLLSCGEKG